MLQSTICCVMRCWSPETSNILKKAFHEYLRDSGRYFVSMRNSICRAEAKLKLLAVAHDGENVDAEQVEEAWDMSQRSIEQYEAPPKSFD